jgi:DNA-binding IclR family transcriptional regulator
MEPTDDASVIDKAFRILGVFDEKHNLLPLSNISRRAHLPLTTTHRIVGRLLSTGALERVDTGEYRIGLRLWEIGSLSPRSGSLQRVALPFMHDLYETTRCPVHLAIREGGEVVLIASLVPKRYGKERPRVGGRYAIHATAVGHVLLAFAPRDIQDDILAQPLELYTPYTETDPAKLRQVLKQVRREGLATSDRQVDRHLVSIAAPIYDAMDEVVAALSIIVPFEQIQGRSWGYLVQAIARGISRAYKSPKKSRESIQGA